MTSGSITIWLNDEANAANCAMYFVIVVGDFFRGEEMISILSICEVVGREIRTGNN